MPTLKRLLTLLAAAAWPWLAQAASPSAVVQTEQVRAELVAQAPDGVGPGKPFWLGLQIEHQPHWHTYWKNPGDSGLPTTLIWQLPAGLKAGEIAWPTPMKLPVGPLMNYGYEGKLLLPVAVTVGPEFSGNSIEVKLSAQWLVCKDVCIPQQGEFALNIPVQASTASNRAAFDAALAALPTVVPGAKAEAELIDGAKVLRVSVSGLPAALQGKALAFFAETPGVVDPSARHDVRWDGSRWQALVQISQQRFESPAQMKAVLLAPGAAAGVQVDFAISGMWPALAAPTPIVEAQAAATPVTPAPAPMGLGLALTLAVMAGKA